MKRVVIYGRGFFWNEFKSEVERDYQVVGFLDSYYEGEYEGMPCTRIDNFDLNMSADYILIMISNPNMIFEVIRNLIKIGMSVEKILIGCLLYGEKKYGCNNAKCTEGGNICLQLGEIEIEVSSAVELEGAYDTIVCRAYDFHLNNKKKSVVLDIGANIGDSALFFLRHPDVVKVYSFEPFEETYKKAEKNLRQYISTSRLELLNYGLSNVNEMRNLVVWDEMSVGLSTSEEMIMNNQKILKIYIEDNREERVCVEVKRASEVIRNIIKEYKKDYNIVLKMDCEGEEFVIMDDLRESNILEEIDLIMLEWHHKSEKTIIDHLREKRFSYVLHKKNKALGLLWAWK